MEVESAKMEAEAMTTETSQTKPNQTNFLLNNLLNNKSYNIKSFSIPNNMIPTLLKLEDLGRKERKDRSYMIVSAIKEYVERHNPGNPQLTFTRKAELYFPPHAKEIVKARQKPKSSRYSRELIAKALEKKKNGGAK